MISFPGFGVTSNSEVTSFPFESLTTAVPVTFTGCSPTSFSFAYASKPDTVYVFPSTS